jgi:hypothetical protein
MDLLELALTSFTPLPAEPLDQFIWHLQLTWDDSNSRAPYYQLPPYPDRKLFLQLLRILPPFLMDTFIGPLAATGQDFLLFSHVSHLLQERVRFDHTRWALPILLNRSAALPPEINSFSSSPSNGGNLPVAAAAHTSPSSGRTNSSDARRRTVICF